MKASNTSNDYEKPARWPPFPGPAAELNITASFGLSFIGESELLNTFNSVEILEHAIQIADHRLSRAKQEGRNRVCSAG